METKNSSRTRSGWTISIFVIGEADSAAKKHGAEKRDTTNLIPRSDLTSAASGRSYAIPRDCIGRARVRERCGSDAPAAWYYEIGGLAHWSAGSRLFHRRAYRSPRLIRFRVKNTPSSASKNRRGLGDRCGLIEITKLTPLEISIPARPPER